MSDLKIQGVVEMSSEGAENALDRVADKAASMATRVQREGEKAGRATESIGQGAERSAEQFTRGEGRITDSIKRATRGLEQLGKTASQRIELRIAERGLDPAKFEPLLAKLRELEAAQARVGGSSRGMGTGLQNTSYQLQDFIVQVNGGVDATRALGMQLPQMLVGFGAAGAAIGVVAALLPNLVTAFKGAAGGAQNFKEAMSDFDKALGDVGQTTKSFDMEKLYEQFNASSDAVRAATLEQINFQREYLRTTQLVSEKKFGESIADLGSYDFLDKMAGAYAGSGSEKLAKQLGVTHAVAKDLLPILNGLKKGTEDVGLAFERFGTTLLGGNAKAVELATTMATLAKSERDAYAASTALSEAQERMAKGYVTTKEEREKAAKSARQEAEELARVLQGLEEKRLGADVGLAPETIRTLEVLNKAVDRGTLSWAKYEIAKDAALDQDPVLKKEQEEIVKAVKAQADFVGKIAEEENRRAESIGKANEKLRDEIAQIGLSATEQAAYAAAKLETAAAADMAAAAELDNAAALLEMQQVLPDVSAKYRELAEAKREASAGVGTQAELTRQRGIAREADKARKEWEKTAESIERSLTDALLRGFESGKSFAENFRDTLKNMFQTLVLRPVISAVMAPVAGTIAGLMPGTAGAADGTGGLLNLASTGSSLYNLASGGSSLYTNFATSGIGQTLGLSTVAPSFITAAPGAVMAGSGGAIPTVFAAGASELAPAGAALAAESALGAGAGGASLSALGTALPWIGGALAIASLFGGGLFGKKAKTPKINLINADIDGWSQFDTPFGTISGAAKHDKNFAQTFESLKPIAEMDKAIAALLSNSEIESVKSALAGTGTGEVKSKGNVAEDFVRNRLDIITDAIGGWINDLADTAEGELKDVYVQTAAILGSRKMAGAETLAQQLMGEGGREFFRESNTAAEAFARMATALGSVNPVLEQINLAALAMSAAGGNAAEDLVKAFGSLDAMRNATSAYYTNFFSAAERAEKEQNALKATIYGAFASVGEQVPKTRAEFRSLVETLDLTTSSGQETFAALMNVAGAFASVTASTEALAAAERKAVIEDRKAREAAAKASVDAVSEAVKGLREGVAKEALAQSGIIGGIRVSADEYEQFSGFADALATARTELAKLPADAAGAIAAIEGMVVDTVRLLGEQIAPLRLRQGDAAGALAAMMAGVRIPADRYTNADGSFNAGGFNRASLFEQARLSQQLGNQASADALNVQNVGGVLDALSGITRSQDFQFALREQIAGDFGVPIQGALADLLSGTLDYASARAAQGYLPNGIGIARVRNAGLQLSNAQSGRDIDAYKLAIRQLEGFKASGRVVDTLQAGDGATVPSSLMVKLSGVDKLMAEGTITADEYATAVRAVNELFKDVAPLADNLEAQAERIRTASMDFGRAGLESIDYYFGQIGDQVAQMAEAAAAAAEPIALATAAIGRMNSAGTVFGESAMAAFTGLSGGGAEGAMYLNDPATQASIANAALVAQAATIAAQAMTTADSARIADQLSSQFAAGQKRDASLLLDGIGEYDSAGFERAFARLNNALAKGTINADQYRELFDLSIKTYQGTESAANDLQDAFAELRRAAKSLADELLIDKGLTPLSTPQRFAEIRRQYEETIDKARTGDLEAIGDMEGITRTMLEAARNNAGSAEEYNLFSAGTIRTLRDLEAEQPLVLNPTPLLSGRSNATEDMLKELQALRAEIAAMRADNSAENVAIVKATNKTANVLDAVTTGNLTFVTEAA